MNRMLWLFYNINSRSNQYTNHNKMHPTKNGTFSGNPVLPGKPRCMPFCKQHLHSRSMIYNNSRYKMKRNKAIRMTAVHTANNTISHHYFLAPAHSGFRSITWSPCFMQGLFHPCHNVWHHWLYVTMVTIFAYRASFWLVRILI